MVACGRISNSRKQSDNMRPAATNIVTGIFIGFFIGVSFHSFGFTKENLSSSLPSTTISKSADLEVNNLTNVSDSTDLEVKNLLNVSNSTNLEVKSLLNVSNSTNLDVKNLTNVSNSTNKVAENSTEDPKLNSTTRMWVPSNPRGAESLPPNIVQAETDLYPRRLWGEPSEDLKTEPKYLMAFTVGYAQKYNIDTAMKKLSSNFSVLLFHYDGRTTEWNEFEWAKHVIHISIPKQTKWWYAKRFLHPDIVAKYDYIFLWDEDLGVEHFDGEKYIQLVRKHGLEISQPAVEPGNMITWQMTVRRNNTEVHKQTEEKKGWCSDPFTPPCAAFVEIMAPVFSRQAWRCVWYMIQNDLVHGWGLDFALRKCAEPAHEKIGVVDAQWITHQGIPSLGNSGQGEAENNKPWLGVRKRCEKEWKMFQVRVENAEKAYYKSIGVEPPNSTVAQGIDRIISQSN